MEKELPIVESQLLLLTRQFLLEQETERAVRAIALDASLEKHLGIDSLGKVELLHRIEKTFDIQLPDSVLAEADTIKTIAEAVMIAKPAKKFFLKHASVPILESLEIDLSAIKTLQDVLIEYAIREPNRPHLYLQNEEGSEEVITYGELLSKASSVANGLIGLGIKPDDTIAIMLPTGREFFQSFFGILLAGAIPVPIYPPFRMDKIEEYALREVKILNNAEVRALITFAEASILGKILQAYIPSLKAVVNGSSLLNHNGALPYIPRTTDQPALIQYSSGSTGDPKGILLYHENILANIRAIEKAVQVKPTDAVVSWLPLYHDMGLMSWISSLYFGIPITIMSPISFLNRPERWLWSIHYRRATLSAAPNFAYELCVKKIDDEMLEGLDLSSWRLSFNGAEAVNPNTLERFYQRFKKYGFKKETLCPVYGLAEDTVALTVPVLNREFRVDKISREAFEKKMHAVPHSNEKDFLVFVSEGIAIEGHAIRIVDDKIISLEERHVGNVQFRGPSAMQGYYRNPTATAAVYFDGWWGTGDLGYIADGELFITGRKKDLIIKAGRNFVPESIEEVVGNIQGIRKGCVIAFGVTDSSIGTEKLIIAAESKLTDLSEKKKLEDEITEKVVVNIGIPPDQVVIVPLRKIPKTSSGKLQRSQCKESFLKGDLAGKSRAVSMQMATLWLSGLKKRIKRFSTKCLRLVYTFYVGIIILLMLLPVWLLVMITPKNIASNILKISMKILFVLSGCRIVVDNAARLRQVKPIIYVANHFSYADALILFSILPSGTLFIVKKELLKVRMVSSAIKKLGFIAVDRWDFSQNIEDTKQINAALANGNSIMIYPEGTFTYASGLRPFKAGAFQLSVDTKTAICPIALKNTRKLLRDGSILLSPTKILVTVCDLVMPHSNDWQEVVKLRGDVRQVIAKHCGEPTLDLIVAGPVGNGCAG